MTTAHKPTYHAAIGRATQGGYRYHAPRQQYSAKDMAAETVLKLRQVGQNSKDEVALRDLKAELEDREDKHWAKTNNEKMRKGQNLLPDKSQDITKVMKNVDWDKFDDDDDTDDEDSDDSDSDDDDDEEAELMKELEKIKKEREQERKRKELEEQEEEAAASHNEAVTGNPLLNKTTYTMKRRWDEDVVFKHQSRDERDVKKKKFINDIIRSQFHRKFLHKYMK